MEGPPVETPTHGHRQSPTYFLFQIWEEAYQRVAHQQEIYEGPGANPHACFQGQEASFPLTQPLG